MTRRFIPRLLAAAATVAAIVAALTTIAGTGFARYECGAGELRAGEHRGAGGRAATPQVGQTLAA